MNTLPRFGLDMRSTTLSQMVPRRTFESTFNWTLRGWLLGAMAIALTLGLFSSSVAQAQTDPFVGTWKVNVEKSQFGPGTERKSETRIMESSPTGMKVSVDRTNADGSNQQYNFTTNYDGKSHPITGTAPYGADAVAITLGASNNLSFKLTKGGRVVGTGTSVVSADGKTLTITSKGLDASGKSVNSIAVYDKQ
jgi:hypothetical protein